MSGNIFASKKAVKGEKVEEDFLGGGGALDTDLYNGTIKTAYIGSAQNSGAKSFNLIVAINGGERNFQIWMTNRDGDVTYTKNGETHNLPGFNQVNSLAMLLLSKEIGDLDVEERTVKIYDFDAKKELPQAVDCFVELHGVDLQMLIQRQTVDKNAKNENTGEYEPTGETRDQNEVIKFLPTGAPVTLSEVAQYVNSLGGDFDEVLADGDLGKAISQMTEEQAEYTAKWLEKNRGQTYDKSKGAKGDKGKSFGGSNKKSDGGSEGGGKKKSLFND